MPRITRTPNPHARPNRQTMPEAESRLWHHLRNRQLNGHKFRRQHSIGPYIADFACIEARLIIEAAGSQHAQTPEADARRTEYLTSQGWTILRFQNDQILAQTQDVLNAILHHLR